MQAVPALIMGDAISWNGMELTRNIPQDAKTRNRHFKPTIDRYTHKPAIHTNDSL